MNFCFDATVNFFLNLGVFLYFDMELSFRGYKYILEMVIKNQAHLINLQTLMLNNHNQYLVYIWFFTWLLSLIYCIQGKYSPCLIFTPFYFRPFYPRQHGRNLRLVEFQCLILSLLKNNYVWGNKMGWNCMCRGTQITQGEN